MKLRMFQQWREWLDTIRRIFRSLSNLEEIMGALTDAIGDLPAKIAKIKTEMTARIDALEARLLNAGKLDEADRALVAELRGGLDAMDEMNPDAAPEPAPETEAPAEPAPVDPEF